MKKIVYNKPQFIEALTVRVKPEEVDAYLKAEEEIWFEDLCTVPGFIGGDTWVSEDRPGEITCLYYWESREAFESVDPEFAAAHKKRNDEALDYEFLKAWHAENACSRVRSFTK